MNPHSRLASFYRYFYMTENLPNNLCNYFWGLMLAFVCLPFVWLAMLINYINHPIKRKEYQEDGKIIYYYDTPFEPCATGYGIIFTFINLIIGIATIELISKLGISTATLTFGLTNIKLLFYIYGVGILAIASSIGLFFGYMALMRLIPDKKEKELTDEEYWAKRDAEDIKERERREYKLNNPSLITLAWRWLKAFKEKNCPMIDWDYSKQKDTK
jgi:hypothetical protein